MSNKEETLIVGAGGKGSEPQEAPNTLFSSAKAEILDLVSEGEVEGLINGAQSIYLNGTPLKDLSGNYNFDSVAWEARPGTLSQTPISIATEEVSGVQVEHSVNKKVSKDSPGPVLDTFYTSQVDAVRVTLFVPRLAYQDKKGNIHPTSVSFKIYLEKDGDGIWEEVLDTTISGKCTSRYDKAYYLDLPYWWQSTKFNSITIKVERTTADSDNAQMSNDLYFGTYTKVIHDNLNYPNSAIMGISLNAEQFSSIPARAYGIKGVKIKVPSNYTPYDPGHCSRGGIDTSRIACLAQGDSWTGTQPGDSLYSGPWDGTFKVAWTCNPAWVLYDLCTDTRYGLGRWLEESNIDKWSLYEIAKYCDGVDTAGDFVGVDAGYTKWVGSPWSSTSTGSGIMEARFACNLYLQGAQEAYKVINDIASIFRGMIYWQQGQISATQDAPSEPTMLFGDANVLEGGFSYEGSSRKVRHNVAHVSWSNPYDFFQQHVEYVEDSEAIAANNNQIFAKNILAVGCTSQGQAHRVGRWLLYTEKLETEVVVFQTGLEGASVRPGDIIKIADSSRASTRAGGRIVNNMVELAPEEPTVDSLWHTFTTDGRRPLEVRYEFDNVVEGRFLCGFARGSASGPSLRLVVGRVGSSSDIVYSTETLVGSSMYDHDIKVSSIPGSSSKFLVAWVSSASGKISAKVCSISSTDTLSFGPTVTDISSDISYGSSFGYYSIAFNPDASGRFTLILRDPSSYAYKSIAGLVTGDTVTVGSEVTIPDSVINPVGTLQTSISGNIDVKYSPSLADTFILLYSVRAPANSTHSTAIAVGTHVGSTISIVGRTLLPEDEEVRGLGAMNLLDISAVAFNPHDTSGRSFVLAHVHTGASCLVGTISTANSISWVGRKHQFSALDRAVGLGISFDPIEPHRFLLTYGGDPYSGAESASKVYQEGRVHGNHIHLEDPQPYCKIEERPEVDSMVSENAGLSLPRFSSVIFDPSVQGRFLLGYPVSTGSYSKGMGEFLVGKLSINTGHPTSSIVQIDDPAYLWGLTGSPTEQKLSVLNTQPACVRDGANQPYTTQESCINAHIDNKWATSVWTEQRAIVPPTTSGKYTEIEVTPPFSIVPEPPLMWVLESNLGLEAQDFRVLTVKEVSKSTVEITGLEHHSLKYNHVDDGYFFWEKETDPVDNSRWVSVPPVTNIVSSEEMYLDASNIVRTRVTVSWDAPGTFASIAMGSTWLAYPYVKSYQVEWRRVDYAMPGAWINEGDTPSTSIEIDNLNVGDYEFRIKVRRLF
jgi:hypothetical protein